MSDWKKSNKLWETTHLKNQYLIMRHGESTANHERRWVAAPESCCHGYGLTERGRQQVEEAVERERSSGLLTKSTIVLSSDFLRARETAEIVRRIVAAAPVRIDPRLRERACGEMEGRILGPDLGARIIAEVTASDLSDPMKSLYGLETASAVQERFTSLITELEAASTECVYLLVCHGDLLRVGLAAVSKVSPGEHWRFGHISNAGLYHLNQFFGRGLPLPPAVEFTGA
jgi:probable phosphoglycerate mutase